MFAHAPPAARYCRPSPFFCARFARDALSSRRRKAARGGGLAPPVARKTLRTQLPDFRSVGMAHVLLAEEESEFKYVRSIHPILCGASNTTFNVDPKWKHKNNFVGFKVYVCPGVKTKNDFVDGVNSFVDAIQVIKAVHQCLNFWKSDMDAFNLYKETLSE